MRILSVNTFFPYPAMRGMDVIYSNLLRAQARKHDVTMVTLARTGRERELAAGLRDLCRDIHVVTPPNSGSLSRRIAYRGAYAMAAAISGRPQPTFYDSPRALRDLVERLTAESRFDIVELHHSTCGRLVDHVRGGIKVLYMYDAHFRSWERRAATKRGLAWLLDGREAGRYRRFEERLVRKFDGVLFGQDADKVAVESMIGPETFTGLMPNIVDTERFAPTGAYVEPNTVVFVGAMSHGANLDAVMHFAHAVWPRVRVRIPDARFLVVGASPPSQLRALDGQNGIAVHADVPDVRPYIERASVYAVPLRIGSGVKVKIIEALAMGKAIVATSVAAEGMGLADGAEIRIGALDEAFADDVVSLLSSDERRCALEAAARAAAMRLYSIEKGQRDLDVIYDRLVARRDTPARAASATSL